MWPTTTISLFVTETAFKYVSNDETIHLPAVYNLKRTLKNPKSQKELIL